VADVIRVRVKLLVAAGKWQNSGRTPAAVVFRVMADVIPVLPISGKRTPKSGKDVTNLRIVIGIAFTLLPVST
jgi:hypothetical protein